MPNWEHEWGGNRERGRNRRRSPADSGNKDKSCCFGAAAVKAAKRRQWRLARRYAVRCVRAVTAMAVS